MYVRSSFLLDLAKTWLSWAVLVSDWLKFDKSSPLKPQASIVSRNNVCVVSNRSFSFYIDLKKNKGAICTYCS